MGARYNCDIISAQKQTFSCNDSSADRQYKGGNRVQIVGAIKCENDTYTTRSMYCNDDNDDNWTFGDTAWRDNTLHRNAADSNALYYLYNGDGNKVNATPVPYNSADNYFALNGTVQAVCKEGYTSDKTKCVTIGTVAKCTTKTTKAPGIDCSEDGGTKCLQAGTGGYLYCYSESEYANQKIYDLQNSCDPTADMVTIEQKPGIYFTCTYDGKWQKEKFKRCEDDEFPTGCNDIPNCIEDVYDTSSSTPYTGTQVFDTIQISSLCARSRCADGYQKQDDKCVLKSEIERQEEQKKKEEEIQNAKREKCEKTLGEWNGSKCTCTVPDTELREDKCVCKNKAYELDTTNGRCELKSEHKPKKEACESSHGTWDKDHCVCDKSKFLILNSDGATCKCDGADYEYNPEQQKCVLTELAVKRNACNAASDTKWIESEKQCKCTESGKEWNGTMCVLSEDRIKCMRIDGAQWDKKENECVCISDEKEIKDGKCVDSPSTIAKRDIDTSFPRFKALITGLDVNKWKSADGTFNVARLASDSIAGAVLGTASGLITGSIVKKNQVKKGFENVRCVVGNQVVAGYGDEFTVDAQ